MGALRRGPIGPPRLSFRSIERDKTPPPLSLSTLAVRCVPRRRLLPPAYHLLPHLLLPATTRYYPLYTRYYLCFRLLLPVLTWSRGVAKF